MEAMTPRLAKRSKSAGRRTWACSMRKRRMAGVTVGEVRVTMAASGSVGGVRVVGGHGGDLFGGGEGVEGHGVGAVADGVEAELEAGGGALGGHLVEVVLVVAGEAGVAGVVGVGLFEGGGAGAEGAVHEAFEHG